MGTIVRSVKIEPIPEVRKSPPLELHRAIWISLENFLYSKLRRKACKQVLIYYLSDEADDRYYDGRWQATQNDLYYSFSDAAGCCNMSSEASLHWFEISFAALLERMDRKAKQLGYRILEPRNSVVDMLKNGPEYPLVELRRQLYCVNRDCNCTPEYKIFTDQMPNALTFQDLAAKEQALVEQIASTGQCACQLCEYLKKKLL